MLGRRGFALQSAAARVCRESGARVSTNVMLRDLDLLPQDRPDTRRLEVVADGLPLHHGAQLAIDTTMVSPLRRDGVPRPRSMMVDGASLATARRRKERRYPELSGQFGRARLVVLACEVGGRWSDETRDFLRHLAKAKVRGEPFPVQQRADLVASTRSTLPASTGAHLDAGGEEPRVTTGTQPGARECESYAPIQSQRRAKSPRAQRRSPSKSMGSGPRTRVHEPASR